MIRSDREAVAVASKLIEKFSEADRVEVLESYGDSIKDFLVYSRKDELEKPTLGQDFTDSIYEMMEGFGQLPKSTDSLGFPSEWVRALRRELLHEEVSEYNQAEHESDIVEVADALGDMMVIIAGTAIAYNIDLPAVLAEIQRSNLSKIDPETKRVVKREDGKVLKPEGWTPPDIKAVM